MRARRTAVIIWCVMLMGALVLMATAMTLGPSIWARGRRLGEDVAWVALGMALVCMPLSRVLSKRVKAMPGVTADAVALGRSIVASAMDGGSALWAVFAWMMSGSMIAVAALALSLASLMFAFPSERHWQELQRGVIATAGQQITNSANLWMPRGSLARKALACGLLALCGAAAALGGAVLWNEEVLGKPANPAIHAPLSLILALLSGGFGAMTWRGAAASRRPRWERVHGALLLFLAVFLLVEGIRAGGECLVRAGIVGRAK